MENKQSTITITFGDCAENHVGMEKYGLLVDIGQGFSVSELAKLEETIPGSKLHRLEQISEQPEAAILIISGGVDLLLKNTNWNASDLTAEQCALNWDKKAFMYGRVVNKKARWNLCYDTELSKEPDYANGSGRVISYDTVPILKFIMNRLPKIFGQKAENLKGEGNMYYDNSKCGIGFHGDGERRKVIALRLGDSLPICYQWFKDGNPCGNRQDIIINGGDIYIMSEKAVGTDWKKKKIWTLRHAAGCSKFIKLPDISKLQKKANVSQGVVKIENGDTLGNGFKDSKTAVTDIAENAKLEKGSAALKSSEAKAVKPKVFGGVSNKSKAIKKYSGANVDQKISKFTPGQQINIAKKSVVKIARGLTTLGGKKSED